MPLSIKTNKTPALFSAPSPRFDLNVCTRFGARVPPPYLSLFSLSLSLAMCSWLLVSKIFIIYTVFVDTRIRFFLLFFFSFCLFVCLFVFSFAFCLFVQLVVLYLHRAMIKFDRTDLAWKWSSSLISLECPRRVSLPRRRLCNFRASSSSPLPPTVSSPLLFPS